MPRSAALVFVTVLAVGACHRVTLEGPAADCLKSRDTCVFPVLTTDSTLPPGALRGLVVSSEDLHGVPYAQIASVRTRQGVLASRHGEFTLEDLRPGLDTLVVRGLCFRPRVIPTTVPDSGGLRLLVALDRVACITD
jgi:hypothetical protein